MNSVHYQIKGSGPAIVLLHGFMESMEMWHPFLPSLTKDFSVVMIDLPGHGKSKCIDETHSMPLMAEQVKKVLDKENIYQCTIIGHSMGGYVSLAFGRSYPGYLNGLVLFHSNPDEDSEEAKNNRERTIEIVKNDKAGFISSFVSSLYYEPNREKLKYRIERQQEIAKTMKPEGIIAALKGMKVRESSTEFLETTTIPILFIIGKQDSRANHKRLLQHIGRPSHSEALLLDQVGHMGFHEAEHVTLNTIHSFALKCAGL
jgi:pimeloyl-ACP methyl ester carboxylesterase